jgi:hypothetical protein
LIWKGSVSAIIWRTSKKYTEKIKGKIDPKKNEGKKLNQKSQQKNFENSKSTPSDMNELEYFIDRYSYVLEKDSTWVVKKLLEVDGDKNLFRKKAIMEIAKNLT